MEGGQQCRHTSQVQGLYVPYQSLTGTSDTGNRREIGGHMTIYYSGVANKTK